MKTKLFLIFIIVCTMLLTACGSYEKVKTGRYENDAKDCWIVLEEDFTFSAVISYDLSSGGKLEMSYHGTYSQSSESKLDLAFSIKKDTEIRNEHWKIDKLNNTLYDPGRNITFKYCEKDD